MVDGPEVEVKNKPHGNTKGDKPFFRTSSSTKDHVQEIGSSHTPMQGCSQHPDT